MEGKRRALLFLVPLVVVALFLLLDLQGSLSLPAGWLYDAAFRFRPPAPASRQILLLDVDDRAVAVTGAWPWDTEVFADGVLDLKEFGADSVVFDLKLPGTAAAAASAVTPAVNDAFDREFSLIGENIRTLFDGIRRGSVLPRDAPRFVDDLVGLVDTAKARLLGAIAAGGTDPNAELAGALRAFRHAWVGWELRSDRAPSAAPLAVYASARGDGFIEPARDPDGVLRRGTAVVRQGGRYLEEVAFAALLDQLGDPSLKVDDRKLTLGGARPPGMPPRDIALDLADDGRVLLDWPGTSLQDGFRHLSWGSLAELDWLEEDLVGALRVIDRSGLLGARGTALLDRYDDASKLRDRMLRGEDAGTEWLDARARFFSLAQEALLAAAGAGSASAADDNAPPSLADARRILAQILVARQTLRRELEGSFCIVSLATRAEPGALGRTPRGAIASGGSASAALVNTVLAGRRLAEIPRWAAKLLGLALALLATVAVLRLRVRWTLLLGALFAAATVCAVGGLFAAAGWYLDPVLAAGAPLFTCAALAGAKILVRTPGRRSVRRRFASRVSRRSLRRLLAAPTPIPVTAELRVAVLHARVSVLPPAGGAENPPSLASRLHDLHSALARIVLELDGTLGRAEADTIEAYFGAPLGAADDVRRACLCAVRMAAACEPAAARGTPPALSRFGLRIGVAAGTCLAGDLGAGGPVGYAALGAPRDAAVQLAAACERYGVAVLVAGPVWEEGGKELLARMLDRLALPTDASPVRCYELVAELEGADETTVKATSLFNEGLACLEGNDRSRAGQIFERVLQLRPGDGPAAAYAERCRTPS